MWFKVDDRFAFHPKTVAAGNPAIGLWARAGAWSGDQHTGGHIPFNMLPSFGTHTQATALVKAGLWTPNSNSWHFHDWTDYQPSAHDLELLEEARSNAARLGNHVRWHVKRNLVDPGCEHCQKGTR